MRIFGPMAHRLLPLHGLTWCDTVISIRGKGKVTPYQMVMDNLDRYINLCHLGNALEITKFLNEPMEKPVCSLNEQNYTGDINMLRYRLFCLKQERNEALPPTKDSHL